MRIDGRTRLLGLVGRSIAHSLSPRIHNHGIESLGVNLVYLPFEIRQEDLEGFLLLFPRFGGIGLNVTTPHKEAAAGIVRPGDDEVTCTGCCNTITYHGARATGWSTDGLGFCRWMEEQRIRPQEEHLVILGFGATARSLTFHLAAVCRLTIVTRRPEVVERTLHAWSQNGWRGGSPRTRSWDLPPEPAVTLVVAGLPASAGRSKTIAGWLGRLNPAARVVDLNYGSGRTPVYAAARRVGLTAFDGTGLLVHQAALSLSRWLGRDVPAELLYSGLAGQR